MEDCGCGESHEKKTDRAKDQEQHSRKVPENKSDQKKKVEAKEDTKHAKSKESKAS